MLIHNTFFYIGILPHPAVIHKRPGSSSTPLFVNVWPWVRKLSLVLPPPPHYISDTTPLDPMVVFFGAPPNKDPGDALHQAKPATCIKASGRPSYKAQGPKRMTALVCPSKGTRLLKKNVEGLNCPPRLSWPDHGFQFPSMPNFQVHLRSWGGQLSLTSPSVHNDWAPKQGARRCAPTSQAGHLHQGIRKIRMQGARAQANDCTCVSKPKNSPLANHGRAPLSSQAFLVRPWLPVFIDAQFSSPPSFSCGVRPSLSSPSVHDNSSGMNVILLILSSAQ